MSDHWHKHYHGRILNSYADLTLEQRGAAYTILDLIYDAGGPLHLGESSIAGRLQCSIRKWRSLRAELIAAGKFYETEDGALSNSLCELTLLDRRKLAENGSKGGRTRAENAKKLPKNKPTRQATLEEGFKHTKARDRGVSNDTPSEPKGSGADAPAEPQTVKAQIWAVGRPMFDKAGTSKAAAGSVIGALIKRKGEIEALTIITALRADPPMDPEQYLWAIIHGKQALATDTGAAPQLELVLVDGKAVMRPVDRRAA